MNSSDYKQAARISRKINYKFLEHNIQASAKYIISCGFVIDLDIPPQTPEEIITKVIDEAKPFGVRVIDSDGSMAQR